MIVADTDVLIDYLAGHEPGAGRIALELQHGELATTVINRFELLAGVRGRRQSKTVGELLSALVTLPLDQAAADDAAQIQRTLELAGTPIGMADSLIAGIVRRHTGVLLTRNRRHFGLVQGLTIAALSSGS